MRGFTRWLGVFLTTLFLCEGSHGGDWPQFRGPNSSGRAVGAAALPAELGPKTNVIWKTPLPPGHSSPVVVGDRVYLTGVQDKKLLTLALDRKDGKIVWTAEAPAPTLEKVHRIGSHAQPSPAADQERVVSFFGSCGLFCYDRGGKLLWQRPFGPFKNDFGAGSSPILVDGRVLLSQDHDQESFLLALDARTGATVWKADRSEFLRGYCTPVVWDLPGGKQVVVAGTLRVAGYDFSTGKELWTVRGLSRTICATPVVGDDGRLYLSGWAAGGDPGGRIDIEPFDPVIKRLDANGDGKLDKNELKTGPMSERFNQVDVNKDGLITRAEYEHFRGLFEKGRNSVVAIRPGGKGDVTSTHVVWTNTKQVPFCASPLFHDGLIYTVKDGGLLACLEASDGKLHKYERVGVTNSYYSSPVVGDGKIYLLNEEGKLTVVRAGRDWEVLSTSRFEEDAYATPAIVDGRIYLRTAGHLYCFGLTDKKQSSADPVRPPNVVLIVADDMAWTDFGFMGHKVIRTPRLDKLAAESAVFPQSYVPTSLCRASLATLLTGLYGHQHRICCNDPPNGVDRAKMHPFIRNAPALPRLLRDKNYRSFQTGKFWEGHHENAGFTHGMTVKGRHGDEGLVIGRQTMKPILDFIDESGDKPFFVWYAPMLPHEPHNPPARLLAKYNVEGRNLKLAKYYAMCEWLDETVGTLLDHLDAKKLRDDTLVLFVVDNGWIQETGDKKTTVGWFAPKSKLSPYDGGLRIPVLLRWPARIKPGRHDDLVSTVDVVPTILAAAGIPPHRDMQGLNLLDVATGKGPLKRDAVFGELFLHTATNLDAPAVDLTHRWVRAGDWKLIVPVKGEAELYNVKEDPTEKTNRAGEKKDEVARLRERLDQWWRGR